MYSKAHEILGILYSYADEGRYKKKQDKDDGVGDGQSASVEADGKFAVPDGSTEQQGS